jgi:hypothetical protein
MQKTSALDVDLQPQLFSEVEEAKDGRFWCCPAVGSCGRNEDTADTRVPWM